MAAATTTASSTSTTKSSSPPSPPPPAAAAPSQRQEILGPSPGITTPQAQAPLQSSPNPTTPAATVAPETPATSSKQPTPATTTTSRQPEPTFAAPEVIHIPSYSRWFSWNEIHECEVRFLPEFFDWRSPSKNPRVYKYYRNSIIRRFRENPGRKITFTETRKAIIGDVGSVRRVFDFLEAWGLINYTPSSTNKNQLKWEDKDTKSNAPSSQTTDAVINSADFSFPKNRWCSGCKSVCSIACFYCDKYDLTLCARCYVRGNYRVGVSSSDFRRVEISEEVKAEWSDKETLHLLEAIMHFGDDWKKVAEHVGGRSERECVNRFIKLPFGNQFFGRPDPAADEVDDNFNQTIKDHTHATAAAESGLQSSATVFPTKRMRFTPLADASNPIMAQAAFLSALVGADVAEAAARAAVRALAADGNNETISSFPSLVGSNSSARQQESNGKTTNTNQLEEGAAVSEETQLRPEKEVQDLERTISDIAEVQLKEIKEKIVGFEDVELQKEREWQQLELMKNMLFVDQLTLLFHKAAVAAAPTTTQSMEENIKIE